jgi:hypothetical protein
MFAWWFACAAPDEDSGLPALPADTEVVDTSEPSFEIDTAVEDTAGDLSPEHTLALEHEGEWLLAPAGGPYGTMTGSLRITELLDGDELAPVCAVELALTGEAVEADCAGCAVAFEVLHTLTSGALDDCREPGLPADGERWVLGHSPSDALLWLNVGGTGVWVEWYAVEALGDELSFSWTSSVGVMVEEEG